jgi:hypothetical protein
MTTAENRARLVDRILQHGKREDTTVVEDNATAVISGRDGERSDENIWEVVRRCEDCMCDFGFGVDEYFGPASIFFSIEDVALRIMLSPSKIKVWYLTRQGTVPPENINFLRSRIVTELFRLLGPVIDDVPEDDGGEEENPPVINDSSSLWIDDLFDAIRNMGFKDLCHRKLLLGLHTVHFDLKRMLYDARGAIEWRDLKSIFRCFDHELRFGHCKLGPIYNVKVIMVKEAGSSHYLVHRVKDVDLSNPLKIRCHIKLEYQTYERPPKNFRDAVPVYDRREFWFAGEDSWSTCLFSDHSDSQCKWY